MRQCSVECRGESRRRYGEATHGDRGLKSSWTGLGLTLAGLATACNGGAGGGTGGDASAFDAGDGPSLSALSVTSDANADLTLVPAFEPGVHDYYVRCAAGTNSLRVSMTASPGSQISLRQPTSSNPAPSLTFSQLAVNENEAIVAAATRRGSTVEYWVRCLPADFPGLELQRFPDAGSPEAGYYLIGSVMPPKKPGYAMIVDGNGVPVWYHREATGGVLNVDNVIKGSISYRAITGGPIHVERLSTGSLTTSSPNHAPVDPHELRVLPNGHYIVISSPYTTADLTGLNVPLPDGGTLQPGTGAKMRTCNVVEFDPASGNVVWTWRALDHFDPVTDSLVPEALPSKSGPTPVNIFHCNSIDVEPATGDLLVSARNMSSVFYVERSTGKVLWKLGGAKTSLDGAPYVAVDSPFDEQHDARLLPGWSRCGGKLTVFDDESLGKMPARAVMYAVALGSAVSGCGTAAPTAKLIWAASASGSSSASGSFRISTDGSRVIGWGFGAGPTFSEVDE